MIMGAPAAGKGTQCEKIVHKVLPRLLDCVSPLSLRACCSFVASRRPVRHPLQKAYDRVHFD